MEIHSIVFPVTYELNLYMLCRRKYGVNLVLFADDTCLYATERKEGYVLRKLQRGLNSMAAW
jgi:hypothetical protein